MCSSDLLVDTHGRGVERITEKGVVVDGHEYELDCLIYATGFEVGTDFTRRAGYEIHGRDGLTLTRKWADGVRTLHGMHNRGFPNCLNMGPLHSAFTVNYPHSLDEQSKHLAYIIKHAIDNGVRTFQPTEAAEQEWVDTIIRSARMGRQFLEECTPGYYNNEGQLSDIAAQNGFFGGGSILFFQMMKDWREKGSLDGLEVE